MTSLGISVSPSAAMLSRPSVLAEAMRFLKRPSLLPPISMSGKSSVLGLLAAELLPRVLLVFRRAALALAMVSRRAAEDFGDCVIPDDAASVDLEEVWVDFFEGGENVLAESTESPDNVGETFLCARAGLSLVIPVVFGRGLGNASWTDGLGLDGLAATVLLPLTCLNAGFGTPSAGFRVRVLLPKFEGLALDGVESTLLRSLASEARWGRRLGT